MFRLFVLLFCSHLSMSGAFAKDKILIPESAISDLIKSYTTEEKTLIDADLTLIRSLAFRGQTPALKRAPIYLSTAGGPASRKTTILEKFLEEEPTFKNAVYLDPDQRGLKFMANTYIAKSMTNLEIYKVQDLQKVRRNAYEKWRGASNFITNTLLNEAFQNRFDIAHGTTLTGAASPLLLNKLKEAGYEITLLLAFAPENFKKEALEFRNEKQGFYQSTYEDVVEKAHLFPQRMKDYFSFADHLQLFWSEKLGDKIQPAAFWSKSKGIEIKDSSSYKKIVDEYTRFQKKNSTYLTWDELIKKNLTLE